MATPHDDIWDATQFTVFTMRLYEPVKPTLLEQFSRAQNEEKMSLYTYRLKNGERAVIDEDGYGVTEDGLLRSWLMHGFNYPAGGAMGSDFDAVSQVPNDPRMVEKYETALNQSSAGYAELTTESIEILYPYVSPQAQGEEPMSDPTKDGFVSIDYYNGYPIKDLSDDSVFEYIRREQRNLEALAKVPEGAATNAHKKRITETIDKLVAAVNARHES